MRRLRRASYCIPNRQYPKTEYFETVARIKAQNMNAGPVSLAHSFRRRYLQFRLIFQEAKRFSPLFRRRLERAGYQWATAEEGAAPSGTVESMPDHLQDVP